MKYKDIIDGHTHRIMMLFTRSSYRNVVLKDEIFYSLENCVKDQIIEIILQTLRKEREKYSNCKGRTA